MHRRVAGGNHPLFQLKVCSHFGSRHFARVESQPGLSQVEGAGAMCEANCSGALFGSEDFEDEMQQGVSINRPRLSPPQEDAFAHLIRAADSLQEDGREECHSREAGAQDGLDKIVQKLFKNVAHLCNLTTFSGCARIDAEGAGRKAMTLCQRLVDGEKDQELHGESGQEIPGEPATRRKGGQL